MQASKTARDLDSADPLQDFRKRFRIPHGPDGNESIYFCGNSLGLQSEEVSIAVQGELERWARLGVAGHFDGPLPWMPYHQFLRENLAWLAGARPGEVVAMNSLTVNLHLLMVSFYRPRGSRRKILIEKGAFPSDRHAVASQIAFHGMDPAEELVELEPGADGLIDEQAIESWLDEHGDQVALVLWPGVQYATGQAFDLKRIARAGRKAGSTVGFDLAHAAGNLPLGLHDSGADFAVWCSYKYLNAGPGSVAGAFVHERHADSPDLPRFAGWWGHDPDSRFRMGPEFVPASGADGWQLSNPPILAMAPLRASLEVFREAGMNRLREKSLKLTGYLAGLIRERLEKTIEILTPLDEKRRGCQLSLRFKGGQADGQALFRRLEAHGVVGDWREPDIIRIAPVPLYNSFADAEAFVARVEELSE